VNGRRLCTFSSVAASPGEEGHDRQNPKRKDYQPIHDRADNALPDAELLEDGITSLTDIPKAEEPTGIGADDASSFCLQCLTDTEFVGLWL
jgi:hypothetical protein